MEEFDPVVVGAASISEQAEMPQPKQKKRQPPKPGHSVVYGGHVPQNVHWSTTNVTSSVLTPDQIIAGRR